MLFFLDFHVDHTGMDADQLWDEWEKEAQAAIAVIDAGKLQAWKVSGQRRVVAILDVDSHDELDRILMAGLPMAHVLEIEVVPVRGYKDFAQDVSDRWRSGTA